MSETNFEKGDLHIALVGNPNSGKTTLFNLLTGGSEKVGNWPGVTVEQKSGRLRKHKQIVVVDTPGVYSLSPFTPEEQVTKNYLESGDAQLIINIVDCTTLCRSLFLTSQLTELGLPMIVALNMCDEAKKQNIHTDTKKLEEIFGCEFFEISAAKNINIDALTDRCANGQNINVPKRFLPHVEDKSQEAQQRYDKITQTVAKSQHKSLPRKEKSQQKIDDILLNKWLAYPIFVAIMTLVFEISIGLGGMLTDLLNTHLTPFLQNTVRAGFESIPNSRMLEGLVCDGIIGGVMSVVGFVPQIMLLFGCIALLEGSGYMARISFLTDKLLRSIGLGGRSFVCMVLGCGCSVPSVVSTRTIKNSSERDTTITLAPFAPCSAKLAVISFFTSQLFGGNALVAISFYLLCAGVIVLGGLIFKAIKKKQFDDLFVMELPPYRMPTAKSVLNMMWERGKAFLTKAGTIIFAASVVLWLTTNLNWRFAETSPQNSMLADIGKIVAPLFVPLGWNDRGYGWQFAISTLSGIAAKETVVSTLKILLADGIRESISPLGAYSFVAYNLLTVPCVATISAGFGEQGIKKGIISAAFQIATAYVVALTIYQLGRAVREKPAQAVLGCVWVGIGIATLLAVTTARDKNKHCKQCRSVRNGKCEKCSRS